MGCSHFHGDAKSVTDQQGQSVPGSSRQGSPGAGSRLEEAATCTTMLQVVEQLTKGCQERDSLSPLDIDSARVLGKQDDYGALGNFMLTRWKQSLKHENMGQ